jgi:hypothetical protein
MYEPYIKHPRPDENGCPSIDFRHTNQDKIAIYGDMTAYSEQFMFYCDPHLNLIADYLRTATGGQQILFTPSNVATAAIHHLQEWLGRLREIPTVGKIDVFWITSGTPALHDYGALLRQILDWLQIIEEYVP